jgi:DNA helicase HerA-like ATPase
MTTTTPTDDDSTEEKGLFTEESREVLRVRPSEARETEADIEDRIDQIASLHDLRHEPKQGIVSNLFGSNRGDPICFEMIALSTGADDPVEIYYSSESHLDTLEHRLEIIYPNSFDIERQRLDLGANLIEPVQYSPTEFLVELKAGNLAWDLEELLVDVAGEPGADFGGELESGLDEDVEPGLVPVDDGEMDVPRSSQSRADSDSSSSDDGSEETESLSPTEAFDQAQSQSDADSSPGEFETETWARRDDVPSDHRFLRLPDRDGEAVKINPSSKLEKVDSRMHLERPTFTEDRDILARPSRDEVDPCAVRWRGRGTRKGDWMTTLRSDNTSGEEPDDGYSPKPSVLSDLLLQLCEMEYPLVFQITFQARESWAIQASSRQDDLKKGEDTTMEKVVSKVTGPSEARDKESLPSEVTKRINQIDRKNARKTFDVNLRAVAVDSTAALSAEDSPHAPTDEGGSRRDQINSRLQALCPEFDSMDGQFYEVDGTVVEEGSKVSTGTASTPRDELDHLLDRGLTTSANEESRTEQLFGNSVIRSEVVMNPRELSDFIVVPPGNKMPEEAFRGIRAKHQEESPLPSPNPDVLEAFSDGMAIGTPLDRNRNPLDTRIELPSGVLTTHYARFALTGFGKSIATNNDIQTLHANTNGPVIVLDPKGDGMCYRYLMTHYARFGDLDNVYYFNVPEDIPAAPFFDIRPLLARGRAREDAIQDKVDHFHEIMEMVMGPAYTNAYVAIMVLTFLIKAMFDPEYGQDAFTVDDLYEQAMKMQREKRIPRISDERSEIEQSLVRHFENDDTGFKETMTAVLNRLDKIRENKHLYRMFNHVPEWDYQRQTYAASSPSFSFRKFFDSDSVILFDIGDLRPKAAKAMTLILLSNLWDDLQQRDSDDQNTLVNLIIEEAAPFAATDLMAEQLLSKSRSFGLAMGLIMQYPGQVRDEGLKGNERAYNEIKNNVQSTLYGRIQDNSDLAGELATYSMGPTEMKTKLSSLRDGEWVADLPSPAYDAPVPSPFSMQALPIPEGHPESEQPLKNADKRAFERVHLSKCRRRVQDNYSIQTAGRREDTNYTEPQPPEGWDEESQTPGSADRTDPADSSEEASQQPSGPEQTTENENSDTSNSEPGEHKPLSSILDESHSEIQDDDQKDAEEGPEEDADIGERGQSDGDSDDESSQDGSPEELGEFLGSESFDENTASSSPEQDESTESEDTDDKHQEVPPESRGTDVPEHDEQQPQKTESDGRPDPEKSPSGSDTGLGDSPDIEESADEAGIGDESTTPLSKGEPANSPAGTDQESSSEPEDQSQSYDSVTELYREAKEINTTCSGGERFKKLAELSTAAENADLSIDDDQLATITDEDDIPDDVPPHKSSESRSSAPGHTETNPEAESESEAASESEFEFGSESEGENRDESGAEDPNEADTGTDGDSLPEEVRKSAEAAREELQQSELQEHSRDISVPSEEETDSTSEPVPNPAKRKSADQKDIEEFEQRMSERLAKQKEDQAGFSEQPAPGADDVDLSDDDEELLHLILDAMNGELDEFSFTDLETMTDLVNQVDNPDVERLQELDYLEKKRVIRKYFYTVLPKGRAYLGRTLKNRDGVGDLGEKSPHKVGVAALYQLFNHRRDDVDRVKRYQKVGDHKIDVVGYDESGEIVAVGEAETPSNNHDAVVTDYEKMAEVDADAVWLCSSRDTAFDVIKTLEHDGIMEDHFTSKDKKSFSNLKEAVREKPLAGMTEMRGFISTYDEVKEDMPNL